MKILVTGGAGFIGSHVVDACARRPGTRSSSLDDLSTGQRANLNPQARFDAASTSATARRSPTIDRARAAGGAQPPRGADGRPPLGRRSGLRRAGQPHRPAQPARGRRAQHGLRTRDLRLLGRRRLRRAASASRRREDDPTEPVSPYGVTKLGSERYLHYYAHVYGIALRRAALRQRLRAAAESARRGRAWWRSSPSKLLRGEQPVINGDGKQTRDYVYVGDVVRANLLALQSDLLRPAQHRHRHRDRRQPALRAALRRRAASHAPEQHGPAKPGEQMRSVLDPRRAQRVLGWQPQVALEDGLRGRSPTSASGTSTCGGSRRARAPA